MIFSRRVSLSSIELQPPFGYDKTKRRFFKNALNLAENIIRLRHDKKITQEQLADFVGVTKASVSKWETKQSMPDILLLPQLAAFFDVTIDELLGYEPQLSKEQMQKIYLELASDFAKNPFEEVIGRVHDFPQLHLPRYLHNPRSIPAIPQVGVLL